MDEKKTIKISLSTFFLILAIIAICIISYFIFKFYNEKIELDKKIVSLNNENKKLVEQISERKTNITETTVNANTKMYSYEDIKGLYNFNKEFQNQENFLNVEYNLCLYENGTFEYQYSLDTNNSIIGNYRIVDNMIILNKIFKGGNDIGLGTTGGEIELKINVDGTIIDTNNLLNETIKALGVEIDLSNVTLKKASVAEEQEYLRNNPSINTHINNSVSENAIYNGEVNY